MVKKLTTAQAAARAKGLQFLPDQLELCVDVVDTMISDENSWVFRSPVTDEELGEAARDYRKHIKKPMDLGTVKAMLDFVTVIHANERAASEKKRGRKKAPPNKCYGGMGDAVRDILQTFENARRFNPKDHFVYGAADKLEAILRGRYGPRFEALGFPLPPRVDVQNIHEEQAEAAAAKAAAAKAKAAAAAVAEPQKKRAKVEVPAVPVDPATLAAKEQRRVLQEKRRQEQEEWQKRVALQQAQSRKAQTANASAAIANAEAAQEEQRKQAIEQEALLQQQREQEARLREQQRQQCLLQQQQRHHQAMVQQQAAIAQQQAGAAYAAAHAAARMEAMQEHERRQCEQQQLAKAANAAQMHTAMGDAVATADDVEPECWPGPLDAAADVRKPGVRGAAYVQGSNGSSRNVMNQVIALGSLRRLLWLESQRQQQTAAAAVAATEPAGAEEGSEL